MPLNDEEKVMGRIDGEQPEAERDSLAIRLVYMVLIGIMMSVAQTVLWVVALVQVVILLLNRRQPNAELAEFGTSLGIWMAKATRYLTVASEVKPWPWTELD
jgi:hypothetical protein